MNKREPKPLAVTATPRAHVNMTFTRADAELLRRAAGGEAVTTWCWRVVLREARALVGEL